MRFHRWVRFVVALGFVALFLTGSASAALVAPSNGGFETNDMPPYDNSVNDWTETENNVNEAGIIGAPGITGVSGSAVGSFIYRGYSTFAIGQSLGTLDGSDANKVFTLSAGVAGHDWWDFGGRTTRGKFALSFRDGATPGATLLGTADANIVEVDGDNVQGDDTSENQGLANLSATFTPSSADIAAATEVFAVISWDAVTTAGGGENRYVVDNVALASQGLGLATSVSNGGFDKTEPGFFQTTIDEWREVESSSNGAGMWDTGVPPHTDVSGGSGSMIFNNAGEPDATMKQSIGAVGASDVGRTYEFSVGVAAWDWLNRVTGNGGGPFGDGDPSHSGTFTVSFQLTDGTILGMSDFTVAEIVNGNGVQGDTAGETTGLIDLLASYTPELGDVDKEVFAVINLTNDSYAASGQNRYVLDNATLTLVPVVPVVPEPSTFLIWSLGLLGLAWYARRKRK